MAEGLTAVRTVVQKHTADGIPDDMLSVCALAGFTGGIACSYFRWRRQRDMDAVVDLKLLSIKDVAEAAVQGAGGMVKVHGKVTSPAPLRAPCSGLSCVFYQRARTLQTSYQQLVVKGLKALLQRLRPSIARLWMQRSKPRSRRSECKGCRGKVIQP